MTCLTPLAVGVNGLLHKHVVYGGRFGPEVERGRWASPGQLVGARRSGAMSSPQLDGDHFDERMRGGDDGSTFGGGGSASGRGATAAFGRGFMGPPEAPTSNPMQWPCGSRYQPSSNEPMYVPSYVKRA